MRQLLFCLLFLGGHGSLYPHSVTPYLLPQSDSLYAALDTFFSQKRVTESVEALEEAGFEIIAKMPVSFIVVARHVHFPGLIFKIYTDNERRKKLGREHGEALVRRCAGARAIRSLIDKWQMRYFAVPDAWLYPIPAVRGAGERLEPFLLIESDMELLSYEQSVDAWKSLITPQHLAELYLILRAGYGSVHLPDNVPLTASGRFAFVDTENIKKPRDLSKVNPYLSKKMRRWWKLMLDEGLFNLF